MIFTPPSPLSTLAFLLVVDGVIAAVLAGVYLASRNLGGNARRRTWIAAAGIGAWLLITSLVVASGVLAAFPMPGIPIFFAALNIVAVLVALSPVGRWLAVGLPLPALVGFQAFRLPLELVLHSWARQGTIPETMTWTGANLDIISGIVALVAAPFASRSRAIGWLANLVGFVLLLNVGRVAAMSSPLPFAWQVDPPLQLMLHLPYAWIGSICVAGALAGHVVLTRALLRRPGTTP